MASQFFCINRGATTFAAVEAAATQSADVEIRVDTGKNLTKEEVIRAMRMLEDKILKSTVIPDVLVPSV